MTTVWHRRSESCDCEPAVDLVLQAARTLTSALEPGD